MIKNILTYSFVIVAVILMVSCDKEDIAANKLHNGSGIWVIESIQYLEYDTNGNVTADSIIENPGEFVFFSTGSSSALYGYYQGVFIDTEDSLGYPLHYVYDNIRAGIKGCDGPYPINKVYTVEKSGGRKQTWVYYTNQQDVNVPFSMASKEILKLKQKVMIR